MSISFLSIKEVYNLFNLNEARFVRSNGKLAAIGLVKRYTLQPGIHFYFFDSPLIFNYRKCFSSNCRAVTLDETSGPFEFQVH